MALELGSQCYSRFTMSFRFNDRPEWRGRSQSEANPRGHRFVSFLCQPRFSFPGFQVATLTLTFVLE